MRDFLVFRLYGPLASWGDIAVGEQRPTTPHPSKSAVLGLIAAALGVRRDEEERQQALAEGYGMPCVWMRRGCCSAITTPCRFLTDVLSTCSPAETKH